MFMDWACPHGTTHGQPCPPHPAPREALASFLITRGPYAFIGSRGLRDEYWHPLFAIDVGEPLGLVR